MRKLQIWLTPVERDTLETALRYFAEQAEYSKTEGMATRIRKECLALAERRASELLDRIALPPMEAK